MLRVISLNIEYDKHLERVIPFLASEPWDVVLLNELLETDIKKFEDALHQPCFYVPRIRFPRSYGSIPLGHGVFSRFPITHRVYQYLGPEGELKEFDNRTPETQCTTQKNHLVISEITKEGAVYRLGLTHFPWTPDGEADDIQRTAAEELLALVRREAPMTLFGDFNAPRGKEIFALFAKELTDSIPPEYETSLDQELHRAGKLTLMVDGCFTTEGYLASDVSLRFGVSDHAAVLATVSKV